MENAFGAVVKNSGGVELPKVTNVVIKFPLDGVVTAEIEQLATDEKGFILIDYSDEIAGFKRSTRPVLSMNVSPAGKEIVVGEWVPE